MFKSCGVLSCESCFSAYRSRRPARSNVPLAKTKVSIALVFGSQRCCLAPCPVALVEFEKPDGVKRVVRRSTETVYELVAADRALFTLGCRFEQFGVQRAKPVDFDADAGAKDFLIMMEVETADHPLDRSVMCVRVPATSVRLTVDHTRGSSQPDRLHSVKKAEAQPTIVPNSSGCLLPQATRGRGIDPDVQRQVCTKEFIAVGGALITGSARRDGNQVIRPRNREDRFRRDVIAGRRRRVPAVSADISEIWAHCWLTSE